MTPWPNINSVKSPKHTEHCVSLPLVCCMTRNSSASIVGIHSLPSSLSFSLSPLLYPGKHKFSEISLAYRTLCKPSTRMLYDQKLFRQHSWYPLSPLLSPPLSASLSLLYSLSLILPWPNINSVKSPKPTEHCVSRPRVCCTTRNSSANIVGIHSLTSSLSFSLSPLLYPGKHKFSEISLAYRTLCKPSTRMLYDQKLFRQHSWYPLSPLFSPLHSPLHSLRFSLSTLLSIP